MKISVLGIGYVGAVTSACLADSGHRVIAVDPSGVKVSCMQAGKSPIVEKGLGELISKGIRSGRLMATHDYREAILNSEITLVCVGTPSRTDESLDLSYIESACRQVGKVLREKKDFHTVVIRSTVVPGTLENFVIPLLEKESGKKAGTDFGVGNNPEFLRESTAIEDYYHPTQIVVGAHDKRTADTIMSLYNGIEAPRTITEPGVAEGVKYVSNAWRANKIAFANEVGNIMKRHKVDSHKIMRIIFEDKKINMGPSFMLPGYAFGGSCLPKDVRALRASANDKGLETPVFDSLLTANSLQVVHAYDMILQTGKKKAGLLGLSFKPGTDDLRESPLVELADLLLSNGFSLRIYDPCVNQSRHMNGANKTYLENHLPRIAECLVETPKEMLDFADIFIIGNNTGEFEEIIENMDENVHVVDLVRHASAEKRAAYAGICW